MAKINYTVLRNELIRDPIELGYNNKTPEEIAELINEKQFSESAMFDANGNQIFYATGKTSGGSSSSSPPPVTTTTTVIGSTITHTASTLAIVAELLSQQIKRSRAELLFGHDVVVTVDDIDLAR